MCLYLCGDSYFTEKWFDKTHGTFLQAWIRNLHYVKDLVDTEHKLFPEVSLEAYRRLLHAVWCPKGTKYPDMIQFQKVRTECRKRKNKGLHLPEEQVILEVGKRVKGVMHYMLCCVLEDAPPVEWQECGFVHDP